MFKVQKNACSTCIYRKDSTLDLKKLEAAVADKYGGFKGPVQLRKGNKMETYKGHTIQRKDGDKWYYHYSPVHAEGGFTGKAMSVRECKKCIDIHFKKPKFKKLHLSEGLGHSEKPTRDRTRKPKQLVDGPQGLGVYSK